MTDLVKVTKAGAVAELRFNRPEALNALDLPLARAFAAAVADVTGDPAIRAIVLSGEGRAFVAGGDVSAMAADPARGHEVVDALLEVLNPAILALRENDAPVVAAVRGVAAGAGLSLVANADVVVADEGAKFVMAYDQVAGVPDCGGSWFLTHRLGRARVMDMMLTGAPLSATDAQAAGLVSRLCPADEVDEVARALAAQIAKGPTASFGRFRRLVDAAPRTTLADQLAAERDQFVAAAQSEDFREGVAAFIARRKPEFKGR
ncbi:enoyl-CoA hydratase-related protein [Maritimibacter sp. UBA3975]|uniref:enoyl-CoA hydratase-related protein n=1 Tax=Maritimibacter sp. UBA3975 TaxID=1946833 RepID=UPI000C0AFCD9|nr:enoyl-CoA hydratase-related protein [Maritimibacter sp. UBA3975]MAM61315.1 enoyl-CoA hydratase [Maritimibacter sp.]|tara:strand:- start:6216 stop:7001 length:786 start_codon:yes stop_codon:yes gene_type:complete